jgi:DNA polymerase I
MRAFDYETYLLRNGLVAPKPVVMSVTEGGGEQLLTPEQGHQWLIERCKDGESLATANGCFDLAVAANRDPDLLPLVFGMLARGQIKDTHLRQPLLDIGRGTLLIGGDGQPLRSYSLQNIVAKVLGEFVAKENTPRLTYARLDGIPFSLWSEDEREYSRKDARKTLQAVEAQGVGAADDPGILNLALEDHEMRAMWALHLMACWGPRTDPEMVEHVCASVTRAHDEMIAKFTLSGIYRGEGWCRREKQCEGRDPHKHGADCWRPWLPSNVGSRDTGWLQELVRRAYEDNPPRTEGGGIATDRDALMESGDDLLAEIGDAGQNETEYRTYLDVIRRGVSVPVCVRYDPIKATGRVGASNPNLQNPPRGGHVRECFVPRNFRHPDIRERTVYCSTDFPSLELWTQGENLLDMFGDSTLARLLRDGVDLHLKLGGLMDGISYEEAVARKKAGDKRIKGRRQDSKPVNYGLWGGMSDESLVLYARKQGVRFCLSAGADKCGLVKRMGTKGKATGKPLCEACLAEAGKFIRVWKEMLPEAKDYFREVGREADTGLVVVPAPEGLPPMYCADKGTNAAFNIKFQGRAARAAKESLWRVACGSYWNEESPMFGARPTMFLHDEIITEVPELFAHEAAYEQARLMGAALQMWCPKIYCDKACPTPALARRWFKGMEETKDKAGRLAVWWPNGWDWAADADILRNDLAQRGV